MYGLGQGIAQGLATVQEGMITAENIKQNREAARQKAERFKMYMASADQQKQVRDQQLQMQEMELKQLKNRLTLNETFKAFDAYEETGEVKYLNQAKENPQIAKLMEDFDIVSFESVEDLTPEAKERLGVTDDFVKPVLATSADGTKRPLDLVGTYAMTGYTKKLSRDKLEDISTRMEEIQLKATEVQATDSERKLKWLEDNPNKSLADYEAEKRTPTEYAPGEVEKTVEYLKEQYGEEVANAYVVKRTQESTPASIKKDQYENDKIRSIVEEGEAETVSDVNYNKLTGENKLEFDSLVKEELSSMSTSDKDINDQFLRAQAAADKVNVDQLDKSTGLVDASVNELLDTLGIDRNLTDVGNETQMALVRNAIVKATSGSQVTGGEWSRMKQQLGTNFKADATARYKFKNSLEDLIVAMNKRFRDAYPAYYAKNIASSINNMETMISELDKLGTSNVPEKGYREGGYMFKGGDPADKANWERVK